MQRLTLPFCSSSVVKRFLELLPPLISIQVFAAALLVLGWTASGIADEANDTWDVTAARGNTRDIDFDTHEGTWMSLDISPDGRWIVFDLLAHIYRVPVSGGSAECLTQNSGVALNFQPRYSPDGKTIAFISDRKGQNNLWLMDADGANPRPLALDPSLRMYEPAWTPDGQYIVVRREIAGPGLGGKTGLWMYHKSGGSGVELVGKSQPDADWPSVSPDSRFVYFHSPVNAGEEPWLRDAAAGALQIKRLDLRSGEVQEITAGRASTMYRGSSGGSFEARPDGTIDACTWYLTLPDLGSIEAGKLADLVVLNSNPLENIRNTADIVLVMKGGRLYDGTTLDQTWPEKKPFGEPYWLNPDASRTDVRSLTPQ